MGIDGAEAGLGQLLGDAGAQHRRAVQTQHRIHGGIVDKVGNQLIGAVPRFAETGLLVGDVNVVVDMGVVGHEMTLGNPQRGVAVLHGQFYKLDHNFFLHLLWVIKKKRRFSARRKRFRRPLEKRFF